MVEDPQVRFGVGDSFDFTPPSGFQFIFWIISLIAVAFGLSISLFALINDDFDGITAGGIFVVPGCLLAMYSTPTKLQKEFDKI